MLQDLRYAIRILAKAPGVSLAILLTLALGIGANSVLFTAANDYLLRPLPFPASESVVTVSEVARSREFSGWTSTPDYLDWRAQNHSFQDLAAWSAIGVNVTGDGEPERLPGMRVTASFFSTLGVRPALGRNILPGEDVPNGPPVAVISHSLWQRRFGGKSGAIGRPMVLNGRVFSIVGVLPNGFAFSNAHEDVFLPLGLNPAQRYRGSKNLKVIARLKPGVSLEQARSDMNGLLTGIRAADPQYGPLSLTVDRLRDSRVRDLKPALIALLAAAGLVLLIVCSNVANMLLARAASRSGEIAVRLAIGASSGRIVRQMLTESALLAIGGAGLGLLFALWGVAILYRSIPADLQPIHAAGVDRTVFLFSLALAVLTALFFGLAPARAARSTDLVQPLKSGLSPSAASSGARRCLVVVEIALSVMLTSGAAVLLRSFVSLTAVDPGFRPEGVLTVRALRQSRQLQFCTDVLERVRALPGVVAAGAVSNLPMTGQDWGQNLTVEGRPFRGDGDYVWATHRVVSRTYFQAIGMRLVAGRSFEPGDTPTRPRVAVVNETFVKKAFAKDNPVGRQFRIGDYPGGSPVTIAGVVADAKYLGLADEASPEMFFSMDQEGASNGMTFVVRTAGPPVALSDPVRGVIRAVDPNQAIAKIAVLERLVEESSAPQRITALVGGLFGLLALALAATGIYGLISFGVAQRTHEIGVRVALGASYRAIVRMMLGEALRLAGAGIGLGLIGALVCGRFLSALLFRVSPRDPVVLSTLAVVFLGIALAASYLPARRAVSADPLSALRRE